MRKTIIQLVALLMVCGASAKSATAAPAIQVKPHGFHTQGITQTSTNWSGYVMKGNDIRDVRASWVVPSAASSTFPGMTYSSTWVGEDGWGSNTVEQLGTESDYDNSTGLSQTYAWIEMFPGPGYYVTFPNDGELTPGDVITAEVKYLYGGWFQLSMINSTKHWSFYTYKNLPQARRVSAEAIVEAPWENGILPLADYVVNTFTGCSAAVGGGRLVGFDKLPVFPVVMVGNSDIKSNPTGLFSGDGFSCVWENNN